MGLQENDLHEVRVLFPILANYKKVTSYCWQPENNESIPREISTFHPTATQTVVGKNDDYFFSLRANHFILNLGESEECQTDPCLLIIANHKGNLEFELLHFFDKSINSALFN